MKCFVLTFRSLLDTITVNVGEEGTSFVVHEAVIRKSSQFFDKAMKPEWASSRSDPRCVDLSDEKPEVFKVYLHWLYFKTMPTVAVENKGAWNPEYVLLDKCHGMGDKTMDTGFRNAVLKALVDAT